MEADISLYHKCISTPKSHFFFSPSGISKTPLSIISPKSWCRNHNFVYPCHHLFQTQTIHPSINPSHQFYKYIHSDHPPSHCSPSLISCCNTILYTLAFNSVNTKLVFLSNCLNPSSISAVGLFAIVSRRLANYIETPIVSFLPQTIEPKMKSREKGRKN